MIYSIFMRKMKGDSKPFPVSVVVNNFINTYIKKHDIVLCFPGYMSKTQDTIDDFFNEIHFPDYTFFTKGMNGNDVDKSTPLGKKIQDAHNEKTQLVIDGLIDTCTDHAKMMFFLENKCKIGHIDVDYLLNLKVKAILIGSSNQSYNTYLRSSADKGEADILLINGNFIGTDANSSRKSIRNFFGNIIELDEHENRRRNIINKNLRKGLALFEELCAPNDFLGNIYKETIQKLRLSTS